MKQATEDRTKRALEQQEMNHLRDENIRKKEDDRRAREVKRTNQIKQDMRDDVENLAHTGMLMKPLFVHSTTQAAQTTELLYHYRDCKALVEELRHADLEALAKADDMFMFAYVRMLEEAAEVLKNKMRPPSAQEQYNAWEGRGN